jgi:pyrroloquinoline-quinone synthase
MYAGQYYQHVKAFPTYISALHSRCDDLATRQTLLKNLRDEEEGRDHHPGLWLRFAEAVGCDVEEAESTDSLPETSFAVEAFRRAVSNGPVARGLGALYAYEAMVPAVATEKVPAVATEKIDGLEKHYDVSGSPATDYFEVHRTLDIEHADETRELLANRVSTPEDEAEAEAGAAIALDAVNQLLDGICRAHGIAQAA